jgi:ABC-2 type transport system ATP-binding protein
MKAIDMKAIETKNLTKRYGNLTALEGLDLVVEQGEMMALLGVNGAGKTTAIKLLSCLASPSEGEAWLCGHSILNETQEVKRVIGVSPQETAVAKKLSYSLHSGHKRSFDYLDCASFLTENLHQVCFQIL